MRPDWKDLIDEFLSFGFVDCSCGRRIKTTEKLHNHWKDGHFDFSERTTFAEEATNDIDTVENNKEL